MERDSEDQEASESRRRTALLGLIVTLLLLLAGVFLIQKLRTESELEDCFMSGRTNCAPIPSPVH